MAIRDLSLFVDIQAQLVILYSQARGNEGKVVIVVCEDLIPLQFR